MPSTVLNLGFIAGHIFRLFIPWLDLMLTVHIFYLSGSTTGTKHSSVKGEIR